MTKEIFNETSERSRTECYEVVKFRDRAQLMTFIMRDETRHSFGYNALYAARYYEQLLRIDFDHNTVLVTGNHLALLHRAITDHRVVYLREMPFDLNGREGEPLVKTIKIVDRMPDCESASEDHPKQTNQGGKNEKPTKDEGKDPNDHRRT